MSYDSMPREEDLAVMVLTLLYSRKLTCGRHLRSSEYLACGSKGIADLVPKSSHSLERVYL
jgi:hypothetical protein